MYRQFSGKESVSLQQAQSICTGGAGNAALSIPQRAIVNTSINCTTTSYTVGSYNTSCNQVANSMDVLSARIDNQRAQDEAMKNAYSSCMAQNGWNATWLAKSDGSVPTGESAIVYNNCLNTKENKMAECMYEDGLIETKPECNCLLLGGKVMGY